MHPQHQSNNQTKSAALLAAEAAFAPPRYPTDQLPARGSPAVTVTRVKRTAALADLRAVEPKAAEATAPSDAITASQPQRPAPRAPKVFLLKPANLGLDGVTSEVRPLREAQSEGFSAPLGTAEAGCRPEHLAECTPMRESLRRSMPLPMPLPKPMRKPRRDAPLPVTLLYSAAPLLPKAAGAQPQKAALASRVYGQEAQPVLGSARLAASLAEIEPVFAAIKAARGFELDDPQAKAQWDRLSKALDQLAAELRTLSSGPVAPGFHLLSL